MSAVLKSGSDAIRDQVRPLHALRAVPAADAELERLRAALAALAAELAERDAAIAAMPDRIDSAFRDGAEEGREAGRLEAEDKGAATLAAIGEAAEQALVRFAEDMKGLERLAALLASVCLERMLLASDERAAIVAALIGGQVALLAAGAVLGIQVSSEDFAAPEALERLAAGLPGPACEIVASSALASGDCRIALRLGALEVGLDQQWGSLRAALDAMIDAEGAA